MSKLLLIEDDKILGDSLQECLQNEGFEVETHRVEDRVFTNV